LAKPERSVGAGQGSMPEHRDRTPAVSGTRFVLRLRRVAVFSPAWILGSPQFASLLLRPWMTKVEGWPQ
jgi:hypothetical protein